MPSVIRLLPRKKIERHVVPYARLLALVFTKRLLMAARVLLLLSLGLALALRLFVAVSLGRAWLSLALAAAACLVLYKSQLAAEPRAYASIATETLAKLTAKSTWAALAGFALSAGIYFYGLVAASTPYYAVRKASYRALPEGIPASLALHRTDQWFILNEKFLYAASFSAALVLAHTVQFAAANASVLHFSAAESGLNPVDRLLRRVPALRRPALVWAALAAAWPLVYFAAIRSTRWSPLQIAGTVTLSGFKFSLLLLPLQFLPLTLLWTASYEVLTAYLSLGPIYKGKPLSEALQTDKNGSLLDGVSRTPGSLAALTAWYELLVIAEHFEERRRSIYDDVDRDRVVWEQLHRQFSQLLSQKTQHLQPQVKPKKAAAPVRARAERGARPSIVPLTNERKTREQRLVVHGTSEQLYKPESALEKKLASIAQHLETESTSRANRAYAYLKKWHGRLSRLAAEQHEKLLATRLGAPFRRTVPRKLCLLLPHRQETAFAARAIARMTTHSLREDENGYVQGTIAGTLSTLDKFAHELEALVSRPPVDASDVLVRRHAAGADTAVAGGLLGEVNSAFAEVAEAFEPYFKNFKLEKSVQERVKRLHKGELRLADSAWLL